MNPQSVTSESAFRNLCLIVARSFHDLGVAQIEPIAGVEVLAEVDDDLQTFRVGNFDIDWLGGWSPAISVSSSGRSSAKMDEPDVAGGAGGRVDAGDCDEALETGRQPIDRFRCDCGGRGPC